MRLRLFPWLFSSRHYFVLMVISPFSHSVSSRNVIYITLNSSSLPYLLLAFIVLIISVLIYLLFPYFLATFLK